MNVKVEKTDKNIITLEIEVDKAKFEEGMEKSYRKNVKHIAIPGFRKGRAPRKVIEKYYGEAVFYEDAINFVCPDAYDEAIAENNISPVAQPEIDIVQIGEDKNFIFKAIVAVKPEFEVAEYKGIKVDKIEYIPSKEDIDNELARIQEQNATLATIEDRAVENGDIVTIDYEGFVDAGNKYSDDANFVSATMEEFSNMAEKLAKIVNDMVEAISGISAGIEQSASAVGNSAENTSELVSEIANIKNEIGHNQDVVDELKNQTDSFKKYQQENL